MPPSSVPGRTGVADAAVSDQAAGVRSAGHDRKRPDRLHAGAAPQALEILKPYVLGPLYTPPSIRSADADGKKGTFTVPGAWGAGNWHTGAFDPETGMYYAVSLTLPGVRAVASTKGSETATMDYAGGGGGGGRGGQPTNTIPISCRGWDRRSRDCR